MMKNRIVLSGCLIAFLVLFSSFILNPSFIVGDILSGGGDWLVDNGGDGVDGSGGSDCVNPSDEYDNALLVDFEFGLNYKHDIDPNPGNDPWRELHHFDFKVKTCNTPYNDVDNYFPLSHMPWILSDSEPSENYQDDEINGVETIGFHTDFQEYCTDGASSVTIDMCVLISPQNEWDVEIFAPIEIETSLKVCCQPTRPHDDYTYDVEQSGPPIKRNLGDKTDELNTIPNPFTMEVELVNDFDLGDIVNVYNSSGQLIVNKVITSSTNSLKLNTQTWSSGLYIVKLFKADESVILKRIQKI